MMRADDEILTVDDLAKLFSCDKETAAARLTSGDLPGVKVGRGWIIPRQALFERLNQKALEEAAARREQQSVILEDAKRRGTKIRIRTETLSSTHPNIHLPKKKGRKRREPPLLPSLTE